jgi:hypothetical protein
MGRDMRNDLPVFMYRPLLVWLSVLMLCLRLPLSAQADSAPAPVQTVIIRHAVIHAGPGETYSQEGALYPGTTVTILERNMIGNWLHIQYGDPANGTQADGWLITSALRLPSDFRLSSITINADLPDADLSNINNESLAALYDIPIVPAISDEMAEVYKRGQSLGNHRRVITKVGDSVSANNLYLTPLSASQYDLGPYDYLKITAKFFGPSLKVNSAAALVGLTSFSVFDPAWSRDRCQESESPLACEYRLKMPSVAFIMFGANDVGLLTTEQYETQMRQIVDETLSRGIIPVLSTFSADPDADTWSQAVQFNGILAQIAGDTNVPLINLWAAARALPGYGLGSDNAHLTESGAEINFASGYESRYGVSLQNLLALVTLDEIRKEIMQPVPP